MRLSVGVRATSTDRGRRTARTRSSSGASSATGSRGPKSPSRAAGLSGVLSMNSQDASRFSAATSNGWPVAIARSQPCSTSSLFATNPHCSAGIRRHPPPSRPARPPAAARPAASSSSRGRDPVRQSIGRSGRRRSGVRRWSVRRPWRRVAERDASAGHVGQQRPPRCPLAAASVRPAGRPMPPTTVAICSVRRVRSIIELPPSPRGVHRSARPTRRQAAAIG